MIPSNVLSLAERELAGLTHGEVNIVITLHDSKPKFRIVKTLSIVPDKITSGDDSDARKCGKPRTGGAE